MKLTGVFAPLPTPFADDDQLDVVRLRSAVEWWVASPLTGFIVLGSNGEAVLMDDDECDRVVEETRAFVPRGRPLIAGTGRESTRAAIRAAKRAADLGADAVLVRTPGFFKSQMTGDAFVQHYSAVADASPVPVLSTTHGGHRREPVAGNGCEACRTPQYHRHEGIWQRHFANRRPCGEHASTFSVLAGSGSTFFAALCAGVSGGILALAALLPEPCVRLFELTQSKRYDEARVLQQRLMPIARLISSGYGVPGLKAALNIVGCDAGRPRSPLRPIPDTAIAALKEALTKFEEVNA